MEISHSLLNKYEEYRKLTSSLTKEFGLSAKGGMKGLGKGAFQLDHPISFSVLKKTGNLAEAIRVNPVTGDVNQFKKYLDQKIYKRIRLFDDSMENLKALLSLKKDYPDVSFEAYHAKSNGSVNRIR